MLLAWGAVEPYFLHTTKGFYEPEKYRRSWGYFVQTRTQKGDIMGRLSLSKTAGVILALLLTQAGRGRPVPAV
jgi:hypothetical protein